jgi:hypothetical protein
MQIDCSAEQPMTTFQQEITLPKKTEKNFLPMRILAYDLLLLQRYDIDFEEKNMEVRLFLRQQIQDGE